MKIRFIAFATILSILFIVLFRLFKPVFIFVLLISIAILSRAYNHIIQIYQLGLEYYSGSTILTALLLGPYAGMIMGVASQFLAYLFSGKIKYYNYIGSAYWGIIGFVFAYLKHINISYLHIASVILFEVATTPLFIMSGARITSSSFHFITHIGLTLFLANTLTPALYFILR